MIHNVHLKSHQKLIISISSAILLRIFLLFWTSLPAILERRPELTTPITSFRSLREGVFLWRKGVNPYDGGVFYHSPLYLFLFSATSCDSKFTAIAMTTIDIVNSLLLISIWRSRVLGSYGRGRKEDRDALISILYLFNPYSILSCLSRSTSTFDNALVLGATAAISRGHIAGFLVLAVAAHTALYPLLLLPPLLLMSKCKTQSLASFVASFVALGTVEYSALGNLSWIGQTWGIILSVSDLTPNAGMWWYFFTEMFDHFRTFFLGVFQLHTFIYVAPLCIKFQEDPVIVVLVMYGIISAWKSYPAVGDLGVWAGLLGCFPEVTSNLRHPLFTLAVYLYTMILLPLLHSLWLLSGSGNANFFYAATMVHGLNTSLAIVDVTGGAIRHRIKTLRKVPWPQDQNIVQLNKNA